MTDLFIRRYEPADHDAVWSLHFRALDAAGANAGHGPWDDDLHQVADVYLQNGGEFLVGVADDRVFAMGALKRTSAERAEVKRMRVDPACQRRGYGQAMLSTLEARAQELGYRILHLDTTPVQLAAQALYLKNGYREVRRGKVLNLDAIFYEKHLP